MKAELVTEGTLEDSYIFSLFNENKELTQKMLSYIKTGVPIDEDYLQEQIMQIKRSRISPMAEEVLGAYARGEIELLYSRNVKVPLSTPFIVRRDPSFKGNTFGVKATVFIANYGTILKQGNAFDIPMKNLYVLLESAYVALYVHTHPTILQRNYGLMKVVGTTYTNLFVRILNREYALSLDQDMFDRVNFVVSRFFLEKLWEVKNPDIIFNNALMCIQNPNIPDLENLNHMYDEAEIKDVSDMLLFVKGLSPRLDSLSVKYIIQRFMTTYHGGTLLAMDYLPYMMFVMIHTVLGAFILNQTALSSIIKEQKNIRTFYPELVKMIS